ncbi:hypothetical protein PMAYCL1PPCAC_28393, partial [Pristionchus mayeri]
MKRDQNETLDISFKIKRDITLNYAIFSIKMKGWETSTMFEFTYDGLKRQLPPGRRAEQECKRNGKVHHIKGIVIPNDTP